MSSYPELEDVFTMLDLSANSGHYLGVNFAPAELRQARRMLLSRTIHMLHGAYFDGKVQSKSEREHLLEFVNKLSPKRHKFVSLNWDVVLEACLGEVEADLWTDDRRDHHRTQVSGLSLACVGAVER